jgi:hypothetical protein
MIESYLCGVVCGRRYEASILILFIHVSQSFDLQHFSSLKEALEPFLSYVYLTIVHECHYGLQVYEAHALQYYHRMLTRILLLKKL